MLSYNPAPPFFLPSPFSSIEQESNNGPRMAAWQNAHRSSNKQGSSSSTSIGFLEGAGEGDGFVHEKPPQPSYNDDVKEKDEGSSSNGGWSLLAVRCMHAQN